MRLRQRVFLFVFSLFQNDMNAKWKMYATSEPETAISSELVDSLVEGPGLEWSEVTI
jgi:hypothetical protein